MRRTNGVIRLSSVLGAMKSYVEHIDHVLVLGIGVNACVIPGSLTQTAVGVDFFPRLSTIFGSKNPSVFGLDDRPDAFRIDWRNRNPDDSQRAGWQAIILVGQFFPRIAPIR